MQTKKAFKCINIYDESRAVGILTAGKIYPISEEIKKDYVIIVSDDERGLSLVPAKEPGKWFNAGDEFSEFEEVEIEIDQEEMQYSESDFSPEEVEADE